MIKEVLKFPIRYVQDVSKILLHVNDMAEIQGELRGQLDAKKGKQLQEECKLPCCLHLGLLLRLLEEHWVACLLTTATWEEAQLSGHQEKRQQLFVQSILVV